MKPPTRTRIASKSQVLGGNALRKTLKLWSLRVSSTNFNQCCPFSTFSASYSLSQLTLFCSSPATQALTLPWFLAWPLVLQLKPCSLANDIKAWHRLALDSLIHRVQNHGQQSRTQHRYLRQEACRTPQELLSSPPVLGLLMKPPVNSEMIFG